MPFADARLILHLLAEERMGRYARMVQAAEDQQWAAALAGARDAQAES